MPRGAMAWHEAAKGFEGWPWWDDARQWGGGRMEPILVCDFNGHTPKKTIPFLFRRVL
jgi:hypothetical protein